MTLLTIYARDAEGEFKSFLEELRPNIKAYTEAKNKAQFERMFIIGKIKDYQNKFPQRSEDHKALLDAMKSEGWSKDVVSDNHKAYKFYHKILNECLEEWHPLVHAASVSHLAILGQQEERNDGTLSCNSLKYLKRNKKLPSISAMRGFLGGYNDERFQPRFKRSKRDLAEDTSVKSEAFPLEVQVVEDPMASEVEVVKTTQSELLNQLVCLFNSLDLDKIHCEPELKQRLEPISGGLMSLAHIAVSPPPPSLITHHLCQNNQS